MQVRRPSPPSAGTVPAARRRPATRGTGGPPPSPRARRSLRVRRRRAVALAVCASVVVLAIVAVGLASGPGEALPPPPSTPLRAHIVTIAESQLGYSADPAHSYCNKYSAYWGAGSRCAGGLRSEEWCADFAAWVWRKAGALFTYSYAPGAIDASAASFYRWAVDHGTWHPASTGYVPEPGDVAVYGLTTTPTSGTATAAHVAVVTGDTKGRLGPDVVNGDGDHTGFSVVEAGADQYKADVPGGPAYLSGYASPIAPPSSTRG